MKQLPKPEIYEKEELYMPWGILMKRVLEWVIVNAPSGGKVIDLMCGPGQLLGKIQESRNDLKLTGLDNDKRYTDFAASSYPNISFICEDILNWKSQDSFDLVIVTGGIHHIPYEEKENVIKSIYNSLSQNGVCVMADPFIDEYKDEKQRKIAAAKLGYEYMKAVIEKNAPDEIISASIDILSNDVLPNGEYKTSVKKINDDIDNLFSKIEVNKTWPSIDSEYGDYYFILRK